MKAVLALLALGALGAVDPDQGQAPERDDPRGRMAATALLQGERSPEDQMQILRTAESEALKYGLKPGGPERFAAVSGTSWVNLGPTTADFEYNGATYHKIDSGRARKIIVDPRDANVVYFATSGGGVWKTYDALTAVTSTTGPHW